ncbi:glycoside hydrolase family 19 protein [Niveibacterium sp.]|uniref:glycoside hydrolase family 19 protein n=1 Tax=Niveibacterium sp. TaxID=2017444 RepID=UPI0035AE4554
MITPKQLLQILPLAGPLADTFAPLISLAAEEFDIRPGRELAMFVAQAGHESSHLRRIEENLNYTRADRLMLIFPRAFRSQVAAAPYCNQPQRIANRAYAGKGGNGDEASGDGWRFRGRGLFQITLRNGYAACSEGLFGDSEVLLANPDRLLDSEAAARSAAWYWMANNCAIQAARGDIKAVTRIINGPACVGINERTALYEAACAVLGVAKC